jgi:hypothetical protein
MSYRKLVLLSVAVCTGLFLVAEAVTAADIKMMKVGGWVSYKMDSKVEDPGNMMGGTPSAGAPGQAGMAAPGAGAIPGLDPAMLAQLPPEKRKEIEEKMKKAQADAAKKQGASTPALPPEATAAGAAGAKAGAAGGQNADMMAKMKEIQDSSKQMMKDMDMKLKFSVVGEEKRDGKPYVWIEISFSGKLPDMDKMSEKMIKGMPADQVKNIKEKMAEAKVKMEQLPIRTKDNKMKMVMKMLIDKPDVNASIAMALKPIEVWKKEGDNAAVKFTDEQMVAFGKTEETKKTTDSAKSEAKIDSKMETGPLAGEENAAKVGIAASKVDQVSSIANKIKLIPGAAAIPGLNAVVGGLSLLNESMAVVNDVANLQVKASMEGGVKTNVESESETTTRLVSKESKPIAMEEITVVSAGKVKALHTQTTEVRETVSKTKITKAEIDIDVKTNVEVGVQGGAKSTTGKVAGALGKLSDPFGTKKKKNQGALDKMAKGVGEGAGKAITGMETTATTKFEQMSDYWMSPQVPAFGLAKMVMTSQQKGTEIQQNVAMQNQMMNQRQQPKTIMECTIEAMGDKGAISEIQ